MNITDFRYVLCTNDSSLMQLFNACMRHFGITYKESQILTRYYDLDKYIRAIDDDEPRVYIVEKKIEDRFVEDELVSFKKICRDQVIVVSYEFSQDEIVYFFEFGVKSFVTKPISLNKLIEKIKNLINPNKKLSQLIENCSGLIESNQFELAKESIDKIFDYYPCSTRGYLLLGLCYEKDNDLRNAEKYYLEAHETEKLFIEPIKTLINFYKTTGQKDKECYFINEYKSCSPLSFDVRLLSLKYNMSNNTYVKAIEEIEYIFSKIMSRTSIENEARLKQLMTHVSTDAKVVTEPLARLINKRCDALARSKFINPLDYCFFIEGTKIHLILQRYEEALKIVSCVPAKNASEECVFLQAISLFYNKEYKRAIGLLMSVSQESGMPEYFRLLCQCYMACCHICTREIEIAKDMITSTLDAYPKNTFFLGLKKYLSSPDATHRLVETKILKSINYEKLCDVSF